MRNPNERFRGGGRPGICRILRRIAALRSIYIVFPIMGMRVVERCQAANGRKEELRAGAMAVAGKGHGRESGKPWGLRFLA